MSSSDLSAYLGEARAEGRNQGEGTFTLAGEKARSKLAESVPPWLADPWAALSRLVEGIELGCGLEGATISPFVLSGTFLNFDKAGLTILFPYHDKAIEVAELAATLKKVSDHPFSGTSPAEILLSRAVLALTRLGIACHFQLGAASVQWTHPDVDEPTMEILRENSAPWGSYYKASLSHHQKWLDYLNIQSKHRPGLNMQTASQPKIARPRTWDDTGIGCGVLDSFGDWHTGSFFDYRAREAVLLESFHHGPAESPLRISGQIQLNPGSHEKTNSQLSAWERFVGKRREALLRLWGPGLPQIQTSLDGRVPLQAIFAVGLTDKPSQVRLFHWGHVHDDLTLQGCPPGLRGLVWWPGLRQNLYGEAWVRDEEYARAVDWIEQQVRHAFDVLRQESDYLRQLIRSEHSRKVYANEVDQRLLEWLNGPGR